MLLLSLRGTVCLYQGEELGLPEGNVPFEKMQDPYGLRFYPKFKGRDGCRTPMPWDFNGGGFSKVDAWLPIDPEHLLKAVNRQLKDSNSVLNFARTFIRWRKKYPALLTGAIRFLNSLAPILMFERYTQTQCILVVLNVSDEKINIELPYACTPLSHSEIINHLEPYAAFYGIVA